MVPGFGFSVGDFIAGIKLAGTVARAFNDGAGAKPRYRSLVAELNNLVCALNEIRDIQFNDSNASQKTALEGAAIQCQETIENFLRQNVKFQSSLSEEQTTSRLRANMHKVQWAVWKTNEIDQLRTEILGYTTTINTLLIAMQSSAATAQAENVQVCRRDTELQTIIAKETQGQVQDTHDMLRTQAEALGKISGILDTHSSQTKTQDDVRTIMNEALVMNMKVCRLALSIQKSQSNDLPPQIERQHPVQFEDAHGRVTPFHLEFINSFDAFQAVMEIRFRHVPGLKKVQNMEYAIKEPSSNRRLDLNAPWESVFLPGKTVTMSMVFWRPSTSALCCPGCQSPNEKEETVVKRLLSGAESEIRCSNPNCSIWYERIIEPEMPLSIMNTAPSLPSKPQRLLEGNISEIRPWLVPDDEDKIHQFRHVQVRHLPSVNGRELLF